MPPPAATVQRRDRRISRALYLGVLILASVLLWLAFSARSVAPEKPQKRERLPTIPKPIKRRIVAVGDLHGDLEHAMRVLRMAGIVDHRGEWIAGGRTTLVQTGDIVDRGTDTIALYRLFSTLTDAAEKLGGRVVHLLGNHEMMNAMGDWRYVTKQDIATFGGERNRRAAMSAEGWIGQMWLTNYSVAARVPFVDSAPDSNSLTSTSDDARQHVFAASSDSSDSELSHAAAAFVHGGIHPDWAARGIDEINRIGHSLLYRAVAGPIRGSFSLPPGTTQEEADLYGEGGPLWYRGYALDVDEDAVCERAREAMASLGVRHLIMGHTPHFEHIRTRCNGGVIIIDTGISRAYGGALSALEIQYSLSPRPLSSTESSTRGWIEREVVTALQLEGDDTTKTVVSRTERTVDLSVSRYG